MALRFETPANFRGEIVPANCTLAGYSALVHAFSIQAPIKIPACVASRTIRGTSRTNDGWALFDRRVTPENTLTGHLFFALKYETLDLLILKRVFEQADQDEIIDAITATPTAIPSRTLWFLWEWLREEKLPIDNLNQGNYVEILDPVYYITGEPENSSRHRIKNNLLGTPRFCPIVRRTISLNLQLSNHWNDKAKKIVGKVSRGIVARAASFLLLADSKASYEIEGERPPRNRLERWMQAVAQAGKNPISIEELVRLQSIVIDPTSRIRQGLRSEGGFIGERDRDHNPLPEFISARHNDLRDLLDGVISASDRMTKSGVDAVTQAAIVAFAFVVIHPFEDGNGRVHRFLMHHVLAERDFTPKGVTFPISSVLLDRIEGYKDTLRSLSGALMPFIEWRPTADRNVEVLNETADLYRFGDYTEIVEFLYSCVEHAVTFSLPNEINYLKSYDEAKSRIEQQFDMADKDLSLLIGFITQNNGTLSKRGREKEFRHLTDDQIAVAEEVINDAFAPEERDEDDDLDHGTRFKPRL